MSAEEILAHYQAGATTGTITGTVEDEDTGLPIVGATVTANSHQTTTNSTGNYIITLPTGNYTVTASKSGYQSQSKYNISVVENQTTEVNFTLTVATSTTTTIIWPCDLPGDYPPCGEVTLEEVVDFINLWSLGQAELGDVVNLIMPGPGVDMDGIQ